MSSNTKTFQKAESIYNRAAKSEFASDFTTAFNLYLEATDAFLTLSSLASATPAFQAQCKANASKAIQRAEKIKKASKTPGTLLGVATLDWFGPDQQSYVLRKSSMVNNGRYPLWSEPVPIPPDPEAWYSDPSGQPDIPPSVSTTSQNFTWKRLQYTQTTSLPLTPADIEQNIVDDCSLCASVAVCVQHDREYDSGLLSSSLTLGNQTGKYHLKACFNGDCRYVSPLIRDHVGRGVDVFISCVAYFKSTLPCLLNLCALHTLDMEIGDQRLALCHAISLAMPPGTTLLQTTHRRPCPCALYPFTRFLCCLPIRCSKIEAIDDLLPFDDTGRPLGISSGWKGVTWPALIEKAYMKLMGGYDFPGSNSAIDLHVLTGWIPEHIGLQSATFERERTWARISNAFRKGHCVLTVGTDAKTILKIEGLKLLPSHNYAVVDVRETDGERWITLIDSRVPVARSGASSSDSRMLNMRWDDICATFEGVYVSWDPGLFKTGLNFHGVWKPQNADDKVQASVRCLRLLYTCQNLRGGGASPTDTSKDVWVLLTRHISDTRRGAEYVSLSVHEDEDDWRDIRIKMGCMEVKGSYTTSSHALVKTKLGENHPGSSHTSRSASRASPPPTRVSGALSIIASYDGPFDDVYFTVNVLCGASVQVSWDKEAGIGDTIGPRASGFSSKVEGTLTTKNAGGNHTYPTYMLNPQWHLRIHHDNPNLNGHGRPSPDGSESSRRGPAIAIGREKPVVVLSVQGPREVPLNVTAVWSSGERIVELAQKEVVASSGAYTYGRARAAADMASGDYTVILSAFEPQIHLGTFTLKVESSRRFDLTAIPQEGAGMYTRVSKGEWNEQTAVGGPSHGRYYLNPIYEVVIPSSAKFGARVQLTSPSPTASLNVSLYPASTSVSRSLSLAHPLASSGPYSDALSGAYIPPRPLSAGRYWLVPSTWAAGVQASFRLVVYCSDAGCMVSRLGS